MKDLWKLISESGGALDFKQNDTIIIANVDPSIKGNLTVTPEFIVEDLWNGLKVRTNSLDNGTHIIRGPLLGLNRSIETCSSLGVWEETCISESLPSCRETTPKSLWLTKHIRIPVEIVFGWLQDDYKKEYCWSVRQSQPEALSALSLDKLEKLAHSTFKESRIQGHKTHNSSPLQTFTLNGVRFTCPAEESYCTGVDMISNSAEMYFINIPRSTEELLKSLSSSETNKQHPVQCLAGSARIRFTEWSFPSTAFSILARLAMDDDAWVKSARELAIYESVEDATKSIDSGRQYLHKDIVPGKINFTETARDQPTYWAWANDTNWMTQAVFKFQGVSLWNVSARFYPEFRPTLHEFIAKHKPEGRGTENWTLVHWQPGWINQDMELVRRNSIGRSPPLTSFVLIDRPPTNALHALLGEMWGVYMLMIVSLSFATLLACVQCLNERKKLSGRSRVSSVSRDHHGPVSS